MKFTNYGPGDDATWGAPTGHPNDPRTEDDDWLGEPDAATAAAQQVREDAETRMYCAVMLGDAGERLPVRLADNSRIDVRVGDFPHWFGPADLLYRAISEAMGNRDPGPALRAWYRKAVEEYADNQAQEG